MRYLFGLLIPILFLVAACQPANSPASDTSSLSGTDHREGFFDLHVDEETNKIYAKLPKADETGVMLRFCLLYTSPSPRDQRGSRMPSSA